ncbi:MAG: tRNA (N6-isopentenyl adenosine(37)-C2)-methylthiotransferase MiaB [Planctomycetes bacterium]|nr:tRNA (N6-isopentenyl adenosine(37)-C2)-methylthiotransferase MiaB [Planctomycetota bacterium]MCB9904330.1 tRNA (N6-isopentenyl adenosine(37)-C2)-methylthiotransferase MiaB [Planctomycetota bacterium]
MTTTRFQSAAEPEQASGAPKLHIVTFGCQMNKYDSLLVEGKFKGQGYATTDVMADADVILFNTCSVRDHAEERTFSWLGELKHAKQAKPELVIGVMGCMAQRVGEEIFSRAGHVDIVAGTRKFQHMTALVDEVRERRADPETWRARDQRLTATGIEEDVEFERGAMNYTGGQHAYLAVMRGCDLNCTYCIVPTTRGRVRSKPIDEIVAEAQWMVSQGAKVITLLGQTVNSYGEDFPKPEDGGATGSGRQGRPSLGDVLRRLQTIDGLERIRMITMHPAYLTQDLAEAVRDCSKVDRFLPIPAQAGSDDVLRAMKRGYTTDLYRKRLAMLREIVPDVELGSDWIVGFPGETDADFEATLAFAEEVGFVVNYVFKYDPRPTTHAADELSDDVPTAVKKDRNKRLLKKAEEIATLRLGRYVGQTVDVFVEERSDKNPEILHGRSVHGLPVSFAGDERLIGTTIPVAIQQASAYGMHGVVAAANA